MSLLICKTNCIRNYFLGKSCTGGDSIKPFVESTILCSVERNGKRPSICCKRKFNVHCTKLGEIVIATIHRE